MSGPGGVLALHLGTRTGWCYGTASEARPSFGTWRLADETNHAEIGAAFMDALGDHRKLMNPAVIAITSGIGDVDDASAANLAVVQIKLAGLAEVYAWRRSLGLAVVNADEVRAKHLGSSRAQIDAQVTAWARKQGWDAKHPTAAHALLLWHHAILIGRGG
jgi:hypothetical protein